MAAIKKTAASAPEGLTGKTAIFISEMVEHGSITVAAQAAGYSHKTTGYEVLRRPEVAAAVKAGTLARLSAEACPLAVGRLIRILSDDSLPASAHVTAAKVVLDRVLPNGALPSERDIHEMSADELAAAAATARRMMAVLQAPLVEGQAVVVRNASPEPAEADQSVLD